MRLRRLIIAACVVALGGISPTASAAIGAVPPLRHAPAAGISLAPGSSPALEALPTALRGKAWKRIPTRQRVVALTFDGGGEAGGVGRILRTLKREDVPATFFLTGRWARTYPGKTRRISRGGYALGNHTDSHGKVPDMSKARLRSELRATERSIRAAARAGTGPWFRFPYGSHTPRDIARVNDLGYACIQWTVDSAGWLGTSGGMSVDSVVDRVMNALRPGAIVLMHVGQHPTDGSTLDADALPRLIAELREQGYSFTTVEALAR